MAADGRIETGRLHEVLGGRLVAAMHLERADDPGHAGERLRFLVDLTDELQSRYGSLGARWWLERPLAMLGHRTPIELLAHGDCGDAHTLSTLIHRAA